MSVRVPVEIGGNESLPSVDGKLLKRKNEMIAKELGLPV